MYVIGGGLSGLSTAVNLVDSGLRVTLYESSSNLGGRCRSYFDKKLNQTIDNGNHLVLSGNEYVKKYLKKIGSHHSMWSPAKAEFPFFDLKTGQAWTMRPFSALSMISILNSSNRIPGSSIHEYMRVLKLVLAREKTVLDCVGGPGPLYKKFWEPLAVSVLNTEPENASASLFWSVIKQIVLRGEKASKPMIAKKSLSDTFVEPAVRFLEQKRCKILLNSHLTEMKFFKNKVVEIVVSGERIPINDSEAIILALPATLVSALLPKLKTPTEFRPILNGHFKIPINSEHPPLMGLTGGNAQWIFVRNGLASVTISAATSYNDTKNNNLAQTLWGEICLALGLNKVKLGPYRILKEKRATFLQSPQQLKLRPGHKTQWDNLSLAGDWIKTGLPATIEGSIKSGVIASKQFI